MRHCRKRMRHYPHVSIILLFQMDRSDYNLSFLLLVKETSYEIYPLKRCYGITFPDFGFSITFHDTASISMSCCTEYIVTSLSCGYDNSVDQSVARRSLLHVSVLRRNIAARHNTDCPAKESV